MPDTNYKKTKEEHNFQAWLQSISFVDKDRKPISTNLVDDKSDDPENDRGDIQ